MLSPVLAMTWSSTMPDITVTHDLGTDSVNSITSQDPIALNGGTLTIASPRRSPAISTINNATMNGAGDLSVSGLLTFNGALYTTGTTDAYGGMSAGTFDLGYGVLNNHATAT